VTLFQATPLPSLPDLLTWLLPQVTRAPDRCRILALTLPLPSVDPLTVLQVLAAADEQFFYWEQPDGQQVMAALGQVARLELSGPQRFQQARGFVDSCLADTVVLGFGGTPPVPSRFCCGFTFFEDVREGRSPFPAATVFLPRWQVLRRGDRTVLTAHLTLGGSTSLRAWSEEVWEFAQQISRLGQVDLPLPQNHLLEERRSDRSHFLAAVRQALRAIALGDLYKVVLAQALDVAARQSLSPWTALQRLRSIYPECHSFALGNGRGQVFLGASPERLLTVNQGKLSTEALAGSAPRGSTSRQDQRLAQGLQSNPKELNEHRFVADFIADTLRQLGITPQMPAHPQVIRLANIQHLQTPIEADLPDRLHPLDILAQLHPTPAVAGLPRPTVSRLIRQLETFERSLYAAPIGWLDSQNNCEFVVGIRSALLEDNRARLFAGAGIVAGSQPERELAEVMLKQQTLLSALL
jgi:menaquinone-specific isochorismate synthase